MGLIISQQKGLKHLTTCAQLSTLKWKTGKSEQHWAETMRRDLKEAKRIFEDGL